MTPLNATAFTATAPDGWSVGPWRAPHNIAHAAGGTIHEDATARSLGLRGGAVAGSIHMQQCTPLLAKHFGEAWFERGVLSLYFSQTTQDGEPIQARARNAGATAHVEMIAQNGAIIAQGSASLSADAESAVRQRLSACRPAQDLRILAHICPGQSAQQHGVSVSRARLDQDLATITEPLALFSQNGALPYNLTVDVLRGAEPLLAPLPSGVVGLYGAIEVQFRAGPLFADQLYTVRARVLALGETPKTEVLWQSCEAIDASGQTVCRLILMSRVMKASSPL